MIQASYATAPDFFFNGLLGGKHKGTVGESLATGNVAAAPDRRSKRSLRSPFFDVARSQHQS
jgi:hypothetical protein